MQSRPRIPTGRELIKRSAHWPEPSPLARRKQSHAALCVHPALAPPFSPGPQIPWLGRALDAIPNFNPLYRGDNPCQEGNLKYLGEGR